MREPDRPFERPDASGVPRRVEAPPVTLAGAAARMQQLRALCRAGHLRREELEWLGAFYQEPAVCPGGRHCTCPPEAEEERCVGCGRTPSEGGRLQFLSGLQRPGLPRGARCLSR